ncbi:histidine kinase [Streptomyces sp. NPDC052236]|uniref:histidine kinase n=1 Tax=Streptomyces sp. NPDC052236 TaxID=3365686 RepID=UPI0037CCC58D
MTRSRFRLSDDHVFLLAQLATGQPVPARLEPAADELRESGLINRTGELSVLLLPLMKTLVSPGVIISLEAGGRQDTLHHGLLIGDDHVISHESWPGEAEAEYRLVEPKMLVWTLASMVNLQRSAPRHDTNVTVVETTVATVEAGIAALGVPLAEGGEEREHLRKALVAGGAPAGPELLLVADLIADLRSSWRMTAAWQSRQDGQEGVEARGFAIWDCGPLGYWHRELPAEPVAAGQTGPDSTFRLVRVEAKKVWEMITGLLPAEGEITHR